MKFEFSDAQSSSILKIENSIVPPQLIIYIAQFINIVMKNKSKQLKPSLPDKSLNLELTWQKITDMQTALRKIVANQVSLPFNYEHIETLIKFTKEVIKTIQSLKSQQKHYQNIQQNYNMIQSKLANHDSIVNSLQQNYIQRLKNSSDEIKYNKEYYEKAKKNLQESEQLARTQYQQIKKQNAELRYKVEILKKQKEELQKTVSQKQILIKQLQDHKQRFVKISTDFTQKQPKYNQFFLSSILCSSLAHRIASYLPPVDITNLELLNKQVRIYMTKSKKVQTILNQNIIKVKERKIAYYHKHINYFQKLYHKIPEQILHSTFYRYEILKESIGVEILNILNSSANLFEGKFTDVDDDEQKERIKDQQRTLEMEENNGSQTVIIGGMTINIQKQLKNVREFNNQNPSNILQIDEGIVKEFLQDRRNAKQKTNKQINTMYKRIQESAQLYSADVESIGLFLKNILKNFSKVFVLSKNLYAQSRNLQALNTFILRQLSNWDQIQVEKNSQIQDLRAELEAQRKLRIFFTQKNMKSQQRALAQQNVKLGIESRFIKQTEKLDATCKQKQALAQKLAQCQNDIKNLKSDNKQIRKAYQNGKQKYNKILEQLGVVKETILRMNIM